MQRNDIKNESPDCIIKSSASLSAHLEKKEAYAIQTSRCGKTFVVATFSVTRPISSHVVNLPTFHRVPTFYLLAFTREVLILLTIGASNVGRNLFSIETISSSSFCFQIFLQKSLTSHQGCVQLQPFPHVITQTTNSSFSLRTLAMKSELSWRKTHFTNYWAGPSL